MSLLRFRAKKTKEEILYVETISGEAYNVIENLTKVDAARRLIRGVGFLDYEEVAPALRALDELARKLRKVMREEHLEPTPKQIETKLIDLIETRIRREYE
jgi:hypothetical protein